MMIQGDKDLLANLRARIDAEAIHPISGCSLPGLIVQETSNSGKFHQLRFLVASNCFSIVDFIYWDSSR